MKIGVVGKSEANKTVKQLYEAFIKTDKRVAVRSISYRNNDFFTTEFAEELTFGGNQIRIDRLVISEDISPRIGAYDVVIVDDIDYNTDELIIHGNPVIIANSDNGAIMQLLAKNKINRDRIITYGLNNKASITASSIDESMLFCCIQRSFKAINGETLMQQEFSLPIANAAAGVYTSLSSIAAALVCEPGLIEKIG